MYASTDERGLKCSCSVPVTGCILKRKFVMGWNAVLAGVNVARGWMLEYVNSVDRFVRPRYQLMPPPHPFSLRMSELNCREFTVPFRLELLLLNEARSANASRLNCGKRRP